MRQAMVTVARHVQLVPNWHGLCSLLSLTADDISDIEARHPASTTDRCYDSLAVSYTHLTLPTILRV